MLELAVEGHSPVLGWMLHLWRSSNGSGVVEAKDVDDGLLEFIDCIVRLVHGIDVC